MADLNPDDGGHAQLDRIDEESSCRPGEPAYVLAKTTDLLTRRNGSY